MYLLGLSLFILIIVTIIFNCVVRQQAQRIAQLTAEVNELRNH